MSEPLSAGVLDTLKPILEPAFEAMRAGIDRGIHAVGEEAVAAYLVAQYREKIYPIDLPGIHNIIEPAFDEAVCMVIPRAVKAVHHVVHREPQG